jgi:hypothetical protein
MISVCTVTPLERFNLKLVFNDDTEKIVDIEPLLYGPIFEPIRSNLEMFRLVKVDEELGTIVWPNGADIDPDVLYGTHIPAWMEQPETSTVVAY